MRLLPCHSGHRFKMEHWPEGQYYDVKVVDTKRVIVRDEEGMQIIIQKDDAIRNWIHMGATPKEK